MKKETYSFVATIVEEDTNKIINDNSYKYSAYFYDVKGCYSVGDTLEEIKLNLEEALSGHIETLLQEKLEIPCSTSIDKIPVEDFETKMMIEIQV